MRNLINLCTLLTFSAVCFSSCGEKLITHDLTVISDLTEAHFKGFTLSEIRKVSAVSQNSLNGESVRIISITELGFNKTYEYSIKKDSSLLMGNDYERTDFINLYLSQIDTSLKNIQSEKKIRSGSVIFKVMSEELNRLSNSKSDRRTFLINTDFMEMSFINFYDTEVLNTILEHPETVKSILLKKYPLELLNSIDIFFVYLPKDKTDSNRYEIVSEFYKKMFESFGARVHIVGSI